jgi:hypothetical protein
VFRKNNPNPVVAIKSRQNSLVRRSRSSFGALIAFFSPLLDFCSVGSLSSVVEEFLRWENAVGSGQWAVGSRRHNAKGRRQKAGIRLRHLLAFQPFGLVREIIFLIVIPKASEIRVIE